MAAVRMTPLMGRMANRLHQQAGLLLEAAWRETLAAILMATAEVMPGVALQVRHPRCFLSPPFPRWRYGP